MEPMNGVNKFEVDRSDVVLSTLFNQFEEKREALGISDFAITETTLEEVFLSLSNNPIRGPGSEETGMIKEQGGGERKPSKVRHVAVVPQEIPL